MAAKKAPLMPLRKIISEKTIAKKIEKYLKPKYATTISKLTIKSIFPYSIKSSKYVAFCVKVLPNIIPKNIIRNIDKAVITKYIKSFIFYALSNPYSLNKLFKFGVFPSHFSYNTLILFRFPFARMFSL